MSGERRNIMIELRATTSTGGTTTLNGAIVATLKANFRGALLTASDEGYNQARRVWNAMIDRRPALIARCTGAADVVAAVNFARHHDLLVAVRGGGHNVAGSAVCEGGLVIDLSLMRGVRVDPGAGTVRVGGGAVWGDVDQETQLFGLATPNGVVSATGVAGLTLGGGYGWLTCKYGLSCDQLISADVVTADGQLRIASEWENADLFWAIRGGGGNFGVVTSFEFRCQPVGPLVYRCRPVYPIEQAAQVLRGWRAFMATAPEEFTCLAYFLTIPKNAALPEKTWGMPAIALPGAYSGDPAAGERLIRPLRELAEPVVDLSGPIPYLDLQRASDVAYAPGIRQYYWKATHLNGLGDEVIDAILATATGRPTPMSTLAVWHLGGAMSRIAPTATACWARHAPFMVSFEAGWDDPADQEKSIAWTRHSWAKLRQYSDGSLYVNFPGLGEEGEALVRAAYGGNYERLVEVKNKYDPTNLFRLNQNIKPTVRTGQGL
jgi:FAD/FMN-containing dehydrogenase